MGAQHLTQLAQRRRRANVASLIAVCLAIGAGMVAMDPSQAKRPARTASTNPALGGLQAGDTPDSVVIAEVGGEQLVLNADGSTHIKSIPGGLVSAEPEAPESLSLPAAPQGEYYASATGTTAFVGEPGDGRSIGFSSALVSTDGTKLPQRDQLGQSLYYGLDKGTTGVAMSSFVNGTTDPGETAAQRNQSVSPSKDPSKTSGAVNPGTIPAGLTVFGGLSASRTTTASKGCVPYGRVVEANTEFAGGDLLPGAINFEAEDPEYYDTDGKVKVAGLEGLASSASLVELGHTERVNEEGEATRLAGTAVTARAKIRVPMITLLPGSYYKTQIRFLAPIELMVSAGGLPGTARARLFGLILNQDRPVVSITSYLAQQYLTGRYFEPENGLHFDLGNGGSIDLATRDLFAAVGGKSAHGAIDALKITLPKKLGLPHLSQGDDALYLLTGYPSGLDTVFKVLNNVFDKIPLPPADSPLGQREIRIGHMEAAVSVPQGGIGCRLKNIFKFGISDDDTGHES